MNITKLVETGLSWDSAEGAEISNSSDLLCVQSIIVGLEMILRVSCEMVCRYRMLMSYVLLANCSFEEGYAKTQGLHILCMIAMH